MVIFGFVSTCVTRFKIFRHTAKILGTQLEQFEEHSFKYLEHLLQKKT